MNTPETKELQVGQKVINIDNDNDNLFIAVGVLTAVHGEGEFDIETHWPNTISPIVHDGVRSNIYPLPDEVYEYICNLEKHAAATGFFKDIEEDCCDEDCKCGL